MNANANTKVRSLPPSYYKLVKEFPLESIRDDEHFDAAEAMIDRLLRLHLDEGGEIYLNTLSDLVGIFDDEHHPIGDATEAGVLRELMDGNRLTQSQLASEVSIAQSTISAVLNGNRSLTKAQVVKLAKRFNVPAEVFLPR
jgi:HTH-type transcriptional regulator/antitoxin HigA